MTEMKFPHDTFTKAAGRINPALHRSPRVIVVDEIKEGQYSLGELSSDGLVEETTLLGNVLYRASSLFRLGVNAGEFEIDGIKYLFIGQRIKK